MQSNEPRATGSVWQDDTDRAWTDRLASWRVYAAAAGATLAAASTAEANVVYVNPAIKPDAKLNVNNANFQIDGADVVLMDTNGSVWTVGFGWFGTGGNINGYFFGGGSQNFVKNYNAGAAIGVVGGSGNRFRSVSNYPNGTLHGGNFLTGQTGFAGFQLPASKGGGMGWLRVEVISQSDNGIPDELKVIDWAYNDAGGGIYAGEGLPSDVPEPGTLALSLLASGAVGVLSWRKRRAALKKP